MILIIPLNYFFFWLILIQIWDLITIFFYLKIEAKKANKYYKKI